MELMMVPANDGDFLNALNHESVIAFLNRAQSYGQNHTDNFVV